MLVFLLFFVCCLLAESDQLKIFQSKDNLYCFSKVSSNEILTLSQKKAHCLLKLTPPGKYQLEFFKKKKFNNQIALLKYYNSSKDYKGNIKVYPQTNNDYSFKSYYKNLKLLLKRENFSSPDNTIMELSESIPCGDCSEEIIKLYCDPRYITITILNNSRFLKQTINQNIIDSIFDKGIVPLVTQCVLEKTKKKDIVNVTISFFFV